MPKMKTDRGAAKRFKITGTGRILRAQAFRSKHKTVKPSTRLRRLAGTTEVSKADRKSIRRQLGI